MVLCIRAAVVLGHSKLGRGVMSVQQAFSEHPFCAPRPDAMGRWPMEPQSLPRDYAQIQKGHRALVCLSPWAASMLCIPWHRGDNKYSFIFISFPDFPSSFTPPSRTWPIFSEGSFPFFATENQEAVLPGASGPRPKTLRDRFYSSLQNPSFFGDHAIKLHPSCCCPRCPVCQVSQFLITVSLG